MKPVIICCSVLLLMAGCSGMKSCSSESVKSAPVPNTLVINNSREPFSIDPHLMQDVPSSNLAWQLYEGLTEYHPKTLKPIPAMATRWEVGKDGKIYTFYLRKNGKWSNGDPVTAKDFEYSWKRILNPATGSKYSYLLYFIQNAEAYNTGKIKTADTVGVKAVDSYTLKVTLEDPTPFFPQLTSFYTYRPVHKATVEKWGDRWTRPEHFVSNGAYKLVNWVPQKEIVIEKNSHYWDAENVRISRVQFLPIEDLETALKLHKTGKAHYTYELPTLKMDSLRKEPGFHSTAAWMTYYYMVNTTQKPLDDVRVRRALNMAIDKKQIVAVLKKGDFPTTHLVPPGVKGYVSPNGDAFNPVKAQALLKEAGYGDPRTFPRFDIYYNTDKNHKMVAEMVQDMWKRHLGIEVGLINQEWKVLLNHYTNKAYNGFGRLTWVGDYIDPHTFLDLFTSTSQQNNTGWGHSEYDNLVKIQSAKETDPLRRYQILQRAEAILVKELPVFPIFHWNQPVLIDPRLKGFYPNVQDSHPLKFAYFEGTNGTRAEK